MAAVNPRKLLVPANLIRVFELVFAFIALVTVAGWSNKGITYHDLNRSDFNFHHNINFFVAMAAISMTFFAVNVLFLLLNRKPISPKYDLPLCGTLTALVLLSSVILSVTLSQLGKSTAVREAGLVFHSMEAGVAFSFMLVCCLACSTYFAFQTKLSEGDLAVPRGMADLPGDIPT